MSDETILQSDEQPLEIEPYEMLAPIYDQVMSHVNYAAWADFVMDILTDYGLPSQFDDPSPLLLEAACGTGTVAIMTALSGYDIDAFDNSPQMIEIARRKSRGMAQPPRFRIADFFELDCKEHYDGILCLYDSVNYITQPDRIRGFFRLVRQALKREGSFLLDVCTEYNSLSHFASNEQVEYFEGFNYRRVMKYFSKDNTQENLFFIKRDETPEKVFVERHLQKIYDLHVIRSQVEKAGMYILEETDDIIRKPPHEKSLRVHFLCKRY